MFRSNQLDADRAFVLVVDMQEKLLPRIGHAARVIAAGKKLLRGTKIFELPVLATEQHPEGIGPTHGAIRSCLDANGGRVIQKKTFSAWAQKEVREAILELDRPQVVMIGIEAHVCVQQTALDLVSRDYDVFVCADAVGSRGDLDYRRSLDRMVQEGVWVTTVESVLFELCNAWDAPQFKPMIDVIKATPPSDS